MLPTQPSFTADSIHDFRETIEPRNKIRLLVFTGFTKALHREYKFESKAEKDFAIILESGAEKDITKWLRPALKQFAIYYDHNSSRYHPDFVVETTSCIHLVEIKAENKMDDVEVGMKSTAAKKYCRSATEYTAKHGGKPWVYALIPHDAVQANRSLEGLMREFVQL
jgi:type III restriction enzyme